jgi:hypothetical protein
MIQNFRRGVASLAERNPRSAGFLDPATRFDESGTLPAIREMPVDARRAITGIGVEALFDFHCSTKMQVGVLRKIRFANKVLALDIWQASMVRQLS